MKIVGVIGKWEWLLGNDGKSYKRYVGSTNLMAWPLPDSLVGVVLSEPIVKDVAAIPIEPIIVKPTNIEGNKSGRGRPRKEGASISARGLRYRRKAEGLSRGSGRPKKDL